MNRELKIALISTLVGAALAFTGSFFQFQISQQVSNKNLVRTKLESAFIKSEEFKIHVDGQSGDLMKMNFGELSSDQITKPDVNPLVELNMLNKLYIPAITTELLALNAQYRIYEENIGKVLIKYSNNKLTNRDLSDLIFDRKNIIKKDVENLQNRILAEVDRVSLN